MSVMSVLAAISSLLLFSGFTIAAIVAPNCDSLNDWTWASNTLDQNPCKVAAYLGGTCNQGSFTIDSLAPGYSYSGPSGVDNSNLCKCSTVMYSLLSACDGCQGEEWITWSEYSYNCTSTFPVSSFPNPVPDGTSVPHWALLDITLQNSWNDSQSRATGDTPEIAAGQLIGTAASSSSPLGGPTATATSSTSQSRPTPKPGGDQNPPTSSSKKKTNGGAIAGGVAGGVVCIGIASAIFFYCRRRSHVRAPPGSSTVNPDFQPLYHETVFSGAPQGQAGGSPIIGESMYSGSGAMGGMQAPSVGSSPFIGGFQAPSIVSGIHSTSQEQHASPSSASGGQSAAQQLMAEARQTLPDYATIPPSSRTGSPLTQMTFDTPNFTTVVPESSRGGQYIPDVPSQLPPLGYKAGATTSANMHVSRQNEYSGLPMV